jgi:hypothetical protein
MQVIRECMHVCISDEMIECHNKRKTTNFISSICMTTRE